MRKLGLFLQAEKKPACKPRPCRQMTYHGQRIQVDVKVALRRCIANPEMRLFQYTAIDEFARLRFLAACSGRGSYSSADFLKKSSRVTPVGVSRWRASRPTMARSSPTASSPADRDALPYSGTQPLRWLRWVSATNASVHIPRATTAKRSEATGGPETFLFLPQR